MALNLTFTNNGIAAKPYAPVLLGGGRNAAGDVLIHWTPCTRIGAGGIGGLPIPTLSDPDVYQVRVYTDSTFADFETKTATGPMLTYTAADQTAFLGSPQDPIYVEVFQTSSVGIDGYAVRGII